VPELYEPAWSAPLEAQPCESYRGAIVNHHALASDLIVKIMRELARCRPQTGTVIILSPDHFNAGSAPVTTHRKSYATAGSIVPVDEKSVDRLRQAIPTAGESTALFDREHGIGVLIPFLHRVLPDAVIVPVVVKASISSSQRTELAKWLQDESKRGNFILVSSDMSHYLDDSVAIKNDEATKRALVDSDVDFFSSAKDAFTDNGPAIAAAIEALRPKRWLLIDQAISK
jgi:AmmeMemoRadiSam system protein B